MTNINLKYPLFMITIMLVITTSPGGAQPLTKYRSGEVLVQFESQLDRAVLAKEAKKLNVQLVSMDNLKPAFMANQQVSTIKVQQAIGVELLRCDPQEDPMVVANRLKTSPLIKWAEPNYRRQLFAALTNGPNDLYYQSEQTVGSGTVRSWWVDQVQADRVFAEGLVTSTQDIIVAILDTGIRLTHEDLQNKLVTGYDFGSGDNDPTDEEGHGTHVAGIVAAQANNSLGIPGIGYLDSIKLMPIKVADDVGDLYDSSISSAIIWAVDHGAKVINMSFGGPSQGMTMDSAIKYAHNKGCILVAAAGNYANSVWDGVGVNPVMYPASFEHVISVAATNSMSRRASYSEFNNYIDCAAPGGENIASDPAGMIVSTYYQHDSQYQVLYGTSMASPVVAGAAAVLLANHREATPDEIESALTSSADKVDSLINDLDGYNEFLGWGQINLYRAINGLSTYPTSNDEGATYNFPNPFNPDQENMTNILIPQSGDQAQLIIMNSFGHKVKDEKLTGNQVTVGRIISWDGRDPSQAVVANGVYPYILKIDNTVYKNKIVVKR